MCHVVATRPVQVRSGADSQSQEGRHCAPDDNFGKLELFARWQRNPGPVCGNVGAGELLLGGICEAGGALLTIRIALTVRVSPKSPVCPSALDSAGVGFEDEWQDRFRPKRFRSLQAGVAEFAGAFGRFQYG